MNNNSRTDLSIGQRQIIIVRRTRITVIIRRRTIHQQERRIRKIRRVARIRIIKNTQNNKTHKIAHNATHKKE